MVSEIRQNPGLRDISAAQLARPTSSRPLVPIVTHRVRTIRDRKSPQAQGHSGQNSAKPQHSPSELSFPSLDDSKHMHSQSMSHDQDMNGRGNVLAGRFEVLEIMSQKGSTTTYLARGPNGMKVAIKALSLQSMVDWDELEAFERESRAMLALSPKHAAFPSFIEVFEEDNEDHTFYLVQEHVEGPTLAQRLAQGWRACPASLQRLSTQLLQGLQALSMANGGPIAHNAITPDHIILRQTPQGLQACFVGLSAAEQLPFSSTDMSPSLHEDTEVTQQMEPNSAASSASVDGSVASGSSRISSWDVIAEASMDQDLDVAHQQSVASVPSEAQPVLTALSEALAASTDYAAPEALAGEARMGLSDAYSVGAVLAAAATGNVPSFSQAGECAVPRDLQGTRLAAVIQGLLRKDWHQRLTAGQALGVLAGQPVPAMPAAQSATTSRLGIQGLAQRVLQLGRGARAQADAAFQRQPQQQTAGAKPERPQGVSIPAAALGLVMASALLLGPSAPFFLFSFLPFLAAGSTGPRFAVAGSPYAPRPSMGFQTFPMRGMSRMQQQQMVRMMLAQQAQQQQLRSAVYTQQQRQLQRLHNQQMWGDLF